MMKDVSFATKLRNILRWITADLNSNAAAVAVLLLLLLLAAAAAAAATAAAATTKATASSRFIFATILQLCER
jgi:hypothetical protein